MFGGYGHLCLGRHGTTIIMLNQEEAILVLNGGKLILPVGLLNYFKIQKSKIVKN
jgi:hypothetical protein